MPRDYCGLLRRPTEQLGQGNVRTARADDRKEAYRSSPNLDFDRRVIERTVTDKELDESIQSIQKNPATGRMEKRFGDLGASHFIKSFIYNGTVTTIGAEYGTRTSDREREFERVLAHQDALITELRRSGSQDPIGPLILLANAHYESTLDAGGAMGTSKMALSTSELNFPKKATRIGHKSKRARR